MNILIQYFQKYIYISNNDKIVKINHKIVIDQKRKFAWADESLFKNVRCTLRFKGHNSSRQQNTKLRKNKYLITIK
jgi:hypothetical protein